MIDKNNCPHDNVLLKSCGPLGLGGTVAYCPNCRLCSKPMRTDSAALESFSMEAWAVKDARERGLELAQLRTINGHLQHFIMNAEFGWKNGVKEALLAASTNDRYDLRDFAERVDCLLESVRLTLDRKPEEKA